MFSELIRRHKIITAIIILVLLAFVAYGVYIAISRAGKEPVTIYAIPNDTTIMIGDNEYRQGTVYIEPGKYDVTATREGFSSYENTVTITQPNNTEIDISLTPESDEAKQWKEENEEQYLAFQARTGERANEFGREIAERYPIATHLPTGNYIYTISKSLKNIDNPMEGLIIEIDAITGYRQAALDHIRELGFDPTDYEIQFNDYENPFAS